MLPVMPPPPPHTHTHTSAPGLFLPLATFAPGLGSLAPHLHREWAHHPVANLHWDYSHSCHICTGNEPIVRTGTGPTPCQPVPVCFCCRSARSLEGDLSQAALKAPQTAAADAKKAHEVRPHLTAQVLRSALRSSRSHFWPASSAPGLNGLTPATSAPGLFTLCHVCAGTGLTPRQHRRPG
jgi:hypothetical protein